MSKTLVIFMFSPNVDTYVNSISFCHDQMGINKVRLVHVKNAITGLESDTQASIVSNRIWNQIQSLSEGKYIYFPRFFNSQDGVPSKQSKKEEFEVEEISDGNINIYQRVHGRLLDRHLLAVDYQNLKDEVASIIKAQGGNDSCILDVTAATKVPSIDIFAITLALGLKNLCVFELDEPPNREAPHKSLYHALAQSQKFKYTDLLSTPPVQASHGSLVRKSPVLWFTAGIFALVLLTALLSMIFFGIENILLTLIGLVSAIIGIVSSVFALIDHRK